MKALFIYNPHSANERNVIERAEQEMGAYIEIKSLDEVSSDLKKYIRATPALIIVTDDLQGENLMSKTTDSQLLVTAMLYKRLEEEEKFIHQQETYRLDNFVNREIKKAQDKWVEDALNQDVKAVETEQEKEYY